MGTAGCWSARAGASRRIADGRVSAYEGRADVAHADISTLARSPDGSLWVAAMTAGSIGSTPTA